MSATRPDIASTSIVRPASVELRDFGWRPISRRRPVIEGLDLRIEPGERVLLAGPSGAGKSTVLAALAGVLGTTIDGDLTGEANVDGRSGLLLQNPYDSVVADRIGRDVAFGMENAGIPRDQMWPRIRAVLDAVRLDYPTEHPTSALSGGEQQRLALAGVLALRPGLLLLDEPTSMLDARTAESVRTAVLDAVELTCATLIVVEHRIADWLPHLDRVVVLDEHARIVRDSDPDGFARDRSAALETIWMPDRPAPDPLAVPDELTSPDDAPATVHARELRVDLRTRTIRDTITASALQGIDVSLDPGTLTAFSGPSGSGKSTLLATMAGLVKPAGGRIEHGGDGELHRMPSAELALRFGWVPQNPEHGFLATKVRDEIALTAGRLHRAVDVDAILELFGLTHLADANPYRISGGEQRRLALAAALAHRPGVVLLDEPTVGQDRATWAAVAGWLIGARDTGAAVGVATHDRDLIELSEPEYVLREGRNA